MLDRIDLHIEVHDLPYETLFHKNTEIVEDSATVRARVLKAREKQLQRQTTVNARLRNKALEKYCTLGEGERKLMTAAAAQLQLSPRAGHRVLRVARTIADLEGANEILIKHLSEALSYRGQAKV